MGMIIFKHLEFYNVKIFGGYCEFDPFSNSKRSLECYYRCYNTTDNIIYFMVALFRLIQILLLLYRFRYFILRFNSVKFLNLFFDDFGEPGSKKDWVLS